MIFVTGGTGLTGSRLLALLAENDNEQIVALKRPSSDLSIVQKVFSQRFENPEKYLNRIRWVDGDIADFFFLDDVLEEGCEVYHAAAMVSFRKEDAEKIRLVNVEGTANIVNACLKNNVRKLCYVSSIAALGRGQKDRPTVETDYRTTSKGSTVYSASKYEAETEVWRGIAEGLNAVIVNPAVILGSASWDKGSAQLFTTVYNGLKFYTRGTNGYVDVDDVAKAMVMLMKSDISGERFVLSEADLSYKELFGTIAGYFGVKPPSVYASPFTGEIVWRLTAVMSLFTGKQPVITKETARMANTFYSYSSGKIRKATGFGFTPVEKTIERICGEFLAERQKQ